MLEFCQHAFLNAKDFLENPNVGVAEEPGKAS